MRRNLILLSIIVAFNVLFWFGQSTLFAKPDVIYDLEFDQQKVNEKYITAQILSQSLTRVYAMFESNLAVQKNDFRNEDASLPFLKQLTDILNRLEIKTIKLKPKPKEKVSNFTAIPYEIEIQCSFEKLGKFVLELEKNDRLITIDEFAVHNGPERISANTAPEEMSEQNIELTISTITLNKSI
tara:strand:+ start:200 stop:751 length:552 start_codon:yes stop_codon:yes gene_type:complete